MPAPAATIFSDRRRRARRNGATASSASWRRVRPATLCGRAAPQALLKPYLDIVAALNPAGELRVYPGSPLIARALLRPQDRLIACELEPRAAASLKTALRGDPRAKVLAIDGWMALNANVPPKERRGLVLIDPPYEDAADFMRLSGALGEAHRKWPTGIYLLWYPIKERDAPDALARRLRRLGVPKVLRCEITLRAAARRMPAWSVRASSWSIRLSRWSRTCDILLPALGRMFSPNAAHRLDWLAAEAGAATVARKSQPQPAECRLATFPHVEIGLIDSVLA